MKGGANSVNQKLRRREHGYRKLAMLYEGRHRKAGQEIADGGDFERFFSYRGHQITLGFKTSKGPFTTRLKSKILYVLDEEGNPKYQTEGFNKGILLAKNEKGEFKAKTEETLHKMFSTPGLYKFRIEAFNYEDFIKVSREFTVKILSDDESSAPEIYTVTFDANGQGEAPKAIEVEEGKVVEKPQEPVADGWKFEGWYVEAECVNEFNFATSVTGDITLYAKWTAISIGEGDTSEDSGSNEDTGNTGAGDTGSSGGSVDSNTGTNDNHSGNSGNMGTNISSGRNSYSSSSSGSGSEKNTTAIRRKVKAKVKENSGSWKQDSKRWWYQDENGNYPKNEWKLLSSDDNESWYVFDEFGYMRTDWFLFAGNWYYLSPIDDANLGKLVTGRVEIKGKWYYLETGENSNHPKGAMYKNEKTPDGYMVDENRVWIK